MTNREKIMKKLEHMPDIEFAKFINNNVSLESCNFCIHRDLNDCSDVEEECIVCIDEWLGEEAKEE